jgi:hypothetical protein
MRRPPSANTVPNARPKAGVARKSSIPARSALLTSLQPIVLSDGGASASTFSPGLVTFCRPIVPSPADDPWSRVQQGTFAARTV